jgi:ribosome-binding protein aMBF1 (putative translation factor)
MDCQDWTPVTLGHRRGGGGGGGSGGSSRASGTPARPLASAAVVAARRAEEEDIPKLKKHLSSASRAEITSKRIQRGQSQIQLNQECSFPPNTIRDFENGRAVPTPTQLNILNRVLGLALRYESTV